MQDGPSKSFRTLGRCVALREYRQHTPQEATSSFHVFGDPKYVFYGDAFHDRPSANGEAWVWKAKAPPTTEATPLAKRSSLDKPDRTLDGVRVFHYNQCRIRLLKHLMEDWITDDTSLDLASLDAGTDDDVVTRIATMLKIYRRDTAWIQAGQAVQAVADELMEMNLDWKGSRNNPIRC